MYKYLSINKILKTVTFSLLLFVFNLHLAFAAGPTAKNINTAGGSFKDGGDTKIAFYLSNLAHFFSYRIVPFLLGLAFVVFVWGMVQYFVIGGANDDAKAKGKNLMVYAVAAFVVIVIFFGIVQLLANSTGLQKEKLEDSPSGIKF